MYSRKLRERCCRSSRAAPRAPSVDASTRNPASQTPPCTTRTRCRRGVGPSRIRRHLLRGRLVGPRPEGSAVIFHACRGVHELRAGRHKCVRIIGGCLAEDLLGPYAWITIGQSGARRRYVLGGLPGGCMLICSVTSEFVGATPARCSSTSATIVGSSSRHHAHQGAQEGEEKTRPGNSAGRPRKRIVLMALLGTCWGRVREEEDPGRLMPTKHGRRPT